jgi:hypothetical protein
MEQEKKKKKGIGDKEMYTEIPAHSPLIILSTSLSGKS